MCIDGKPCLFLLEKYKKSCLSIKCLKYQTMLQKKNFNHNKSNKHGFKIFATSRILQTQLKQSLFKKINFIIYLCASYKTFKFYALYYTMYRVTHKDYEIYNVCFLTLDSLQL